MRKQGVEGLPERTMDECADAGPNSPRSPRRRVSWYSISTAPKDGTRILGRRTYADRYTGVLKYERRLTFWGKTSHVPMYGWNWGRDVEDLNLWAPTRWRPLADASERSEESSHPGKLRDAPNSSPPSSERPGLGKGGK